MCAYIMAAYLLWMRAPRVDAILAGADDMEAETVTKHIQGVDFVPEKVRVTAGQIGFESDFMRFDGSMS